MARIIIAVANLLAVVCWAVALLLERMGSNPDYSRLSFYATMMVFSAICTRWVMEADDGSE